MSALKMSEFKVIKGDTILFSSGCGGEVTAVRNTEAGRIVYVRPWDSRCWSGYWCRQSELTECGDESSLDFRFKTKAEIAKA